MAIKKSDLYASLWASCDELRGGMDASQYKDYVLFLLFIKYISDKYGNSTEFAPPVNIPAGASFADMVALKGQSDIGDKINTQIIAPLIDANDRLARSDFPDFNDPNKLGEGQALVDRLTNLVAIFENPALNFSGNRAEDDDILGDGYEYLMRLFATESGKSKGQFYTPSEVSRVIAQVIGISPENTVANTTAHDPTCGSGSLLLKVAAQAGKQITLEGQENDVTTAGLARMNMILHDFPTANVLQGNTLAHPKFKDGESLRTYDYVVANPPFSDKSWSNGLNPDDDPFQRFSWGAPPAKQGDYAYLLHIIRSLNSEGRGACILPHGVLFRGNAEAVIREQLVRSGTLRGIIGLPANLFYGTGIPACILVLDKTNAAGRRGILMLDASQGFIKDGAKNRLRERDLHRIVDVFTNAEEHPGFSRVVPFDEITANDYNLNLPRYIDSHEAEDEQDIDAHLHGGIPDTDINALQAYWEHCPGLHEHLFTDNRPGYRDLAVPITELRDTIHQHPEFTAFIDRANQHFTQWRCTAADELKALERDCRPKQIIHEQSETLLAHYEDQPLIDEYAVYQRLMDYWAETMQDDCYLIAADGWVANTRRVLETVKDGKKKGEQKDKGWTCDLVPKPLIVARYLKTEQAELDRLRGELDATEASQTELEEEHGGEDGALKDVASKADANRAYIDALIALWNEEDNTLSAHYMQQIEQADTCAAQLRDMAERSPLVTLKNSKGNLTLKAIKDRLKATGDADESARLQGYLDTDKQQKDATKQAKALIEPFADAVEKRLINEPTEDALTDLHVIHRYIRLLNDQKALKDQIKARDAELDQLAYDKYPDLTPDEIKTLVVDDKWLASLDIAIHGELDRVSQTLTGRIKELAERYATPLPRMSQRVADLEAKVDGHLQRMGFA